MEAGRLDPALYYLMVNCVLTGLSGGYVDDLLRVGDSYFRRLLAETNKKLNMAYHENLLCSFTRFPIDQDK